MTCMVHYVLHYAIKTKHRALSCIYVHATGRVIFSKDSRASESVVEQNYWLSTISPTAGFFWNQLEWVSGWGGSDIAAQVATFVQFQRDGIGGHSWICSVWSGRWERLKEPKLHSWNSLNACWLTHGVRKQDKSHWPIHWSFFLFSIHPFIRFISFSLLFLLCSFSMCLRRPSKSL